MHCVNMSKVSSSKHCQISTICQKEIHGKMLSIEELSLFRYFMIQISILFMSGTVKVQH